MSRNFEQPNVGIGLCVIKDKSVLLHKRKGTHAPGAWAFPGGHLEKYETFGACAMREFREEAGPEMQVGKLRYWDVMNTMFFDEGKHYVVIFLWTDWISGEPIVMEPEKNAGWDWFPWVDLPDDAMQGLALLKMHYPKLP